ncbi:DegT/DnrJ/EryC1/StrS family aminotransferase [Macromonas nakdongensis]|uniref:DegT/DnrJ/EryC1/StrS family aminotransferase n=1 Tax=Macromonas nakdongensis TaxID=1843082 RepID=UPI000C31D5CB|nr:DegT/DnrJ/EryC1/StrS aminotransferase family protein [Macromonas nakdongensis]
MLNTLFSPWPNFTDEEAAAVQRVLLSNKVNYWTGTECREFEKEFAAWAGTRHAVALANGTLALDVALKALKIGPGDEVVVTPRTFIASVSCVVNAGATPVFADVDANSGNITAKTIEAVLTPRTKAVICVHLAGWPCDMDPIMALAEQHGLKVIEDCAQAHGARYKDRSVGSMGHVGAWSFCQDKIMTTGGEGGMVTTNDDALWRAMWSFKDHGKSYEAVYERQHPPGFRWLHESFGTNWRMLEMQAAIGRIQLRRMTEWTARRQAHAAALVAALQPFAGECGPVRLPQLGCHGCAAGCGPGGTRPCATGSADCVHGQYKFYAYVRPHNLDPGWSRDRIIEAINAEGVPCYQGSCSEVYLEKAFDDTGWRPAQRLPVARELGETSLMFLVHPTLTEDEITRTVHAITTVLKASSSQETTSRVRS